MVHVRRCIGESAGSLTRVMRLPSSARATSPGICVSLPVIVRLVLVTTFGLGSLWVVVPRIYGNVTFGWDAIVYIESARALVRGSDPWLVHNAFGIAFAAPPPSLIPFLPFIWVPDWAVADLWIIIAAGSAFYSIRRLGLPWWWLIFPATTLAIAAGSSALLCLALLIRGGAATDGLATVTRIYAGLPLAILGRWRSVLVSMTLLAITAPFLAWPAFIADRDRVANAFQTGAANVSATAIPWLIPVAIVCLVLLGRTRAAWLVVPVLWPFTQPYYAVIALPVLGASPLIALSLAIPVPGLVVVGMIGQLLVGSSASSEPIYEGAV